MLESIFQHNPRLGDLQLMTNHPFLMLLHDARLFRGYGKQFGRINRLLPDPLHLLLPALLGRFIALHCDRGLSSP